jgi:hypothetical protein
VTIGLAWPNRGRSAFWNDGAWHVIDEPSSSVTEVSPLLPLSSNTGVAEHDPWYVIGDPIRTLTALRRTLRHSAQLVYLDAPRIETNQATFPASDEYGVINTWLTVMQQLIANSAQLLSDQGVIAVMCGQKELPYLQLLLNELGPANHVGTIVWQKGYAPRNMKNMTELSPTHDNIVLHAFRRSEIPPVALRVPAEGFVLPDGDPRGAWKAEQKGANKPDCSFDVHIPPYRFSLVSGSLPPGIWRINPQSGVIWGRKGDLIAEGSWSFTVRVTDSAGATTDKEFTLDVSSDAPAPALAPPSWLVVEYDDGGHVRNAPSGGGKLRITTASLPRARIGAEYSACIEAAGGAPYEGTTRPGKTSTSGEGRFWEFPAKTLLRQAARDAVDFKKKADAIPALKKYAGADNITTLNQTTVWSNREGDPKSPGYGQAAKEELEALVARGVLKQVMHAAKPLNLMMRLVALLSRENGMVIDIGSPSAELATAATMGGRRVVYVELSGSEDTRESVRLPRLRCAARGLHPPSDGAWFEVEGPERAKGKFYVARAPIPVDERRDICQLELGPPAVRIDRGAGTVAIDYNSYPSRDHRFPLVLASIDGLVPVFERTSGVFARSLDGHIRAVHVASSRFLDLRTIEQLRLQHANHIRDHGVLRVYYHRGEPPAPGPATLQFEFRRVPFELRPMAGIL